jgi:hypothetical protein
MKKSLPLSESKMLKLIQCDAAGRYELEATCIKFTQQA